GGLGEQLDKVLAKIAVHLNDAERAMVQALSERVGISRELPEGAIAASLREACESFVEADLAYYSASSDRTKLYRVKPLALLSHSGSEYVVALDTEDNDHEKLFRLDRIGSVQVTSKSFVKPADFDLNRFRTQTLYFGERAFTAEVWFAKSVAREVAERFTESDITRDGDGSLRVRVSTSSPAWLARWVLPFGANARVLSPEEPRAYIAKLCAEAASAYRQS
ncbi:MAG: WYL domain-containing protein, partial [Clostridia bacterium]|nr:WYL domain-containing protein [Deltaproteobacteria bacterium]